MNQEASPNLRIRSSRRAGADHLRLDGEVDLGTAPHLRDALAAAGNEGAGPVVLDLSNVTFMDSTGLHCLLNAQRRLVRQRRRLVLVCPPGDVLHVLKVSRLTDTFEVHPSLEAALGG